MPKVFCEEFEVFIFRRSNVQGAALQSARCLRIASRNGRQVFGFVLKAQETSQVYSPVALRLFRVWRQKMNDNEKCQE